MVATILLACGAFSLLRTSGTSGDGHFSFHLRWTPTPEQRLLALAPPTKPPAEPPAPDAKPLDSARVTSLDSGRGGSLDSAWGGPAARSADPASPKSDVVGPAMIDRGSTRAEWPGFRGPGRDGVIPGVRIAINWATSPPIELWRRPIGPGWSSFAVHGDRLYTQEQRGDNEIVGCYNARTGEPVWQHRDAARFWEAAGGAGPRATPTLGNGRVYTFGATGILNALDAGTGAVVWSRNAAADAGVENPGWGFASSPLLVNDVVIVAASGRLAAYDVATGHPRWFGPKGGNGYSSPHLVTIDGVAQILLLRGSRTISVAPADGALLWEHVWQLGVGIVQPALIADGEILIVAADSMGGQGLRRIAVSRGDSGWTVEERWTSRGLKPYFNDFVVHKGHAFGFDGSILASIDLTDGQRTWKGGRYGNGQLVLLPDQDALLVLSEEGEIAVVEATPDQFREHARFKALEGKTWNHPVIVGDVLLVRNGEEMAAFRLSLAGR
jgi:outer membrane protein assembly factor BamB